MVELITHFPSFHHIMHVSKPPCEPPHTDFHPEKQRPATEKRIDAVESFTLVPAGCAVAGPPSNPQLTSSKPSGPSVPNVASKPNWLQNLPPRSSRNTAPRTQIRQALLLSSLIRVFLRRSLGGPGTTPKAENALEERQGGDNRNALRLSPVSVHQRNPLGQPGRGECALPVRP